MSEPKTKHQPRDPPHGHRDRDSSHEQPRKGEQRQPTGSHDPDSARIEADETFRPDRDGSGF